MIALLSICVKFASSLTQTICCSLGAFPGPSYCAVFTEFCRIFGFGFVNTADKRVRKIFFLGSNKKDFLGMEVFFYDSQKIF